MLNLITDRIQSDVALVEALSQIKYADMSPQQKAQWDGILKGSYDYRDLNRVQDAILYLRDLFVHYGYATPEFVMTTWGEYDKPTPAQLVKYLADVKAIKQVFKVTSQLPPTVEGLSVEGANQIERALLNVEDAIHRMEYGFIPCGEALCGGDNL